MGRFMYLLLLVLQYFVATTCFAAGDDFHGVKYLNLKAGIMTPHTEIGITEAVSMAFGLTQNSLVGLGAGYFEVNRQVTYKATDDKVYIVYANARDVILEGDIKYYLPRFNSTSIRPFFGPGVGYHMLRSEVGIDGDADSTIREQYSAKMSRSKTSIDLIAGLSSFWTQQIALFVEAKYRFMIDEKYNVTSFTSGFSVKLDDL